MNNPSRISGNIAHYEKITAERTRRALAAMKSSARHLFEIIPVLLHYNHPLLPGFIPGSTPHGICNFHLSDYQQDYLDRISNVGNCNIASYIESPAILSLYCMGSTSSIGQTAGSDLDIWVCYSHLMDPEKVSSLEQKCGVISNMAQNQNFEVNFFLVPDDKFRSDNTSSIDSENCGSALHLLLLEEFYRSSLWLAGKKLVWYLVSEEHDTDNTEYDKYVNELFASGEVKSTEWFDLGSVNNIPVQEFFGSAMWLLYKGVDSPFKATIKILLMEAYADDYPRIRLVANDIRRKIQSSERYDISMDSYYSVYERIVGYLKKIDSRLRLDMLQVCFLMKVVNGMDFNDSSVFMQWRINFVNDFIRKNNIPRSTLDKLLDQKNWKIGQVVSINRRIVDLMLESSSRLRSFSSRVQKLGCPIDITDFQILTQKLSSAFEYKKNKIQKVNLNISPSVDEKSVNEKNVTLVYVPAQRINRYGWYLYTSAINPSSIVRSKCAYFNQNIVDVLLWSIVNGVITRKTRIFLSENAPEVVTSKIYRLVSDLLDIISNFNSITVTNKDLVGPMYFKRLCLLLNISSDLSSEQDKKELELANVDVLSFGVARRSLVNCIDVVYANSWGEIFVNHYEGNEEIIKALSAIANVRNPEADVKHLPPFRVYSYSQYLTGIVKQQVSDLLFDLLKISSGNGNQDSKLVFMLGNRTYAAMRNAKDVTIEPLLDSLNYIEFIRSSEIRNDKERSRSPELEKVYQYSCSGVVQFFFEELNEGFRVFVLDEDNQLRSYISSETKLSQLVEGINKNYQERMDADLSQGAELSSRTVHFSLPQFFQIKNRDGEYSIKIYSAR